MPTRKKINVTKQPRFKNFNPNDSQGVPLSAMLRIIGAGAGEENSFAEHVNKAAADYVDAMDRACRCIQETLDSATDDHEKEATDVTDESGNIATAFAHGKVCGLRAAYNILCGRRVNWNGKPMKEEATDDDDDPIPKPLGEMFGALFGEECMNKVREEMKKGEIPPMPSAAPSPAEKMRATGEGETLSITSETDPVEDKVILTVRKPASVAGLSFGPFRVQDGETWHETAETLKKRLPYLNGDDVTECVDEVRDAVIDVIDSYRNDGDRNPAGAPVATSDDDATDAAPEEKEEAAREAFGPNKSDIDGAAGAVFDT